MPFRQLKSFLKILIGVQYDSFCKQDTSVFCLRHISFRGACHDRSQAPFPPAPEWRWSPPPPPCRRKNLPGALDLVRRLGMEPVLYPSCYFANRDGYLAATDAQRAEDINRAFADKTIDGVWCIRGGYGGHRILPLLDADAISEEPQVVRRLFRRHRPAPVSETLGLRSRHLPLRHAIYRAAPGYIHTRLY